MNPTILVCVDTTNNSEGTLLYACHIAKKSDFTVQILVVIESAKSLLFVSKEIGKNRRLDVEKKLEKLLANIQEKTGIIPSISVREGEVVREIIAEIKDNSNCVMMVFGKSYNAHSDNKVLPKLSAQIGDKIKVPVLIVPDNLGDDYIKKLF
ncbi:MAG: nucleotide-binding universal stress UspA family protein [Rickettsiales bacterium]|jgi:nucleotide-binding universal stress UspA family protein